MSMKAIETILILFTLLQPNLISNKNSCFGQFSMEIWEIAKLTTKKTNDLAGGQ